MDKNLLEFWGNYLFNLSQIGQRLSGTNPYEDAFNFWSGFMKDQKTTDWNFNSPVLFEKQLDFFRKCLGQKENATPDYFSEAGRVSEVFQKSLNEYIAAFNVVPREEHDRLKQKYEELEKRSAEQDDTIRQLRAKLLIKGAEEIGAASGIQEMIRTQTEQFSTLMDSLSSIYGGNSAKQEKPERAKRRK